MSAALAGGPSRLCLREWLLLVPDPRKRAGRWHPLEFVLALAVCAFTAAGHDSPTAIAEWAAGCPREVRKVRHRLDADGQRLFYRRLMQPGPPGPRVIRWRVR